MAVSGIKGFAALAGGALTAVVCAAGPAMAAECAAPVFVEDMETDSAFRRALAAHPLLTVDEADEGGHELVASYVGNEHGSARIVVHHELPETGTDYTLTYRVWLADDFQFVLGGKMHGLGPRRIVAGGDPMRPDGWSSRVMWREGGAPVNYVYHQNQPGKYGEDGAAVTAATFTPGRWQQVAIHIVLNTPEGGSGSSRVYLDGELVNELEDITYRTEFGPHTDISRILFSTFFGGNSPDWAPKDADGEYVTLMARFDDFAVYPGLCTGGEG